MNNIGKAIVAANNEIGYDRRYDRLYPSSKYGKWFESYYGLDEKLHISTLPWSFMFLSYCLYDCVDIDPCIYGPGMYQKYKQRYGESEPQVGSIVFYEDFLGCIYHGGIVVNVDEDWMNVIEGNVDEQVTMSHTYIDRSKCHFINIED